MGEYSKKKAVGAIALAGAVSVGAVAVAMPGVVSNADEPKRKDNIRSKGNLEFDNDGDSNADIKFHATDLEFLADEIDNLEESANTRIEGFADDVKGGKIGLLSTIGALNNNPEIGSKVSELSDNPDAAYPTWAEISQMIEDEAEAKREAGYSEGVNDTLVSNSVNIGYHVHSTACQCGNAGVRQEGDSGDWHSGGNGWQWWSVSYYCTRCNAYRGSTGETLINGYVAERKNTVTPTCTNITCGRTPGSSIDTITINGMKYDVLNGTITQVN